MSERTGGAPPSGGPGGDRTSRFGPGPGGPGGPGGDRGERGERPRGRFGRGGARGPARRKQPIFADNEVVDYKDISRLRLAIDERGKILPRRKTHCSAHIQREL
ncbi:MAG: 30S ribosomal protein S18, partial [Thermomicrobiales bacterium]